MDLLTTSEAADYLRLKERKIYEMVAEGSVPCTKVTGRWLFPKAELDQWLAASLVRPDGMVRPDPPPIVGGSHDPLLEWAIRESGCGLATLPVGSEAGLERFSAGAALAAGIHLHALDDIEADANVAAMRGKGEFHDAVLIAFCRREQGLMVASGNPKKLKSIDDAVGKRACVGVRPKGAGAQLLLLGLLRRSGLAYEKVNTAAAPSPTGPDLAQAIRAGRADCGIATRAVAEAAGLDFVPLLWERFDLVMRQRGYFTAPMQTLVSFMRSKDLTARAREMGGYDVADSGAVRFVN
ncbi:MAG: substrate-binding domain-containing protein [Pseudolabrys sp.]